MVQGALHGSPTTIEDMGIDHGRRNILMSEEFLNGADIVACFQQMSGEAMAEGMTTDGLVGLGSQDCLMDRLLKATLVSVMASNLAGSGVARQSC